MNTLGFIKEKLRGVGKRIAQRLTPSPVRAYGERSMLYVPQRGSSEPNDFLLDVALRAVRRAREISLADLTERQHPGADDFRISGPVSITGCLLLWWMCSSRARLWRSELFPGYPRWRSRNFFGMRLGWPRLLSYLGISSKIPVSVLPISAMAHSFSKSATSEIRWCFSNTQLC